MAQYADLKLRKSPKLKVADSTSRWSGFRGHAYVPAAIQTAAERPGNLQYANDETPPPLSIGIWHLGAMNAGSALPAVALPSIHLPGITFDAGLIYLAVVAVGPERLDDSDWRRPDFRKMSLGLQASGLVTAVSGALGGVAAGMSSANLSLAYATGVTSRIVAMAAGAILIAVAFVPVALGHVLSLPDGVVAGILFYAACYFIVSGPSSRCLACCRRGALW